MFTLLALLGNVYVTRILMCAYTRVIPHARFLVQQECSLACLDTLVSTVRGVIRLNLFVPCRFHHLKLYPEDDSGPQNTKKPVVVESYDEIVFTEPSEAFFSRIKNFPIVSVNGMPLTAGVSPPVISGWLALSLLAQLVRA